VLGNGRVDWGMRVSRWRPSTYRQIWMYAPLGFGVPGFCIRAFLGPQRSLIQAFVYAASLTLLGGLAQSWRFHRRGPDPRC
jgi:hypothetical protein